MALRLSADALRQVRGGHPWVYAESITSVSVPEAQPGALAVVFDERRRFAAIGLWDPTSPIRVRILHHGQPRPIDADHWRTTIRAALEIREDLPATGTTGYRLLNGENDRTGGLVADRYGDTVVLKLYTVAWLPHLHSIVDALTEEVGPTRIVLRLGRRASKSSSPATGVRDGMVVLGTPPDGPVAYTENGLHFAADVVHGQKTGTFHDQRENRARVRDLAAGARVLDVFSGTGGFTVHAAIGGAALVHAVDQSPHAITAVVRNLELNEDSLPSVERHTTIGDAFEVMGELADAGRRFDVVIVDPPAFAASGSDRPRALAAYGRLARLAVPLVRSGGRLVQASCSTRITEGELVQQVEDAVHTRQRRLSIDEVTGHAVDHPIRFPQGRYLKAVFATLH